MKCYREGHVFDLPQPSSLEERSTAQARLARWPLVNASRASLDAQYIQDRNKVVELNAYLAYKISYKHWWCANADNTCTVELTDYIQAAMLGLIEACARWDPAKGRFGSYASFWIRNNLQKVAREHLVPHDAGITLTEEPWREEYEPYTTYSSDTLHDAQVLLCKALHKERHVLHRRFMEHATLQEVAHELKVTRQMIRVYESQGIRRIQDAVGATPTRFVKESNKIGYQKWKLNQTPLTSEQREARNKYQRDWHRNLAERFPKKLCSKCRSDSYCQDRNGCQLDNPRDDCPRETW